MKPARPRASRSSPPELSAVHVADALFDRVVAILEAVRARVVKSVDTEMVLAYWEIGREIVEEVQQGQSRAAYGGAVIASLSASLTARYKWGYSERNLKHFRFFYLAYADHTPEIRQSLIAESQPTTADTPRPACRATGPR